MSATAKWNRECIGRLLICAALCLFSPIACCLPTEYKHEAKLVGTFSFIPKKSKENPYAEVLNWVTPLRPPSTVALKLFGNGVKIIDLKSGAVISSSPFDANCVSFSCFPEKDLLIVPDSDEKRFVPFRQSKLFLWNYKTNSVEEEKAPELMNRNFTYVKCLDSIVVEIPEDSKVTIKRYPGKEVVAEVPLNSPLKSSRFSSDGRYLCILGETPGTPAREVLLPGTDVKFPKPSPPETRVAEIALIDLASGDVKRLSNLPAVEKLSISSDGALIALELSGKELKYDLYSRDLAKKGTILVEEEQEKNTLLGAYMGSSEFGFCLGGERLYSYYPKGRALFGGLRSFLVLADTQKSEVVRRVSGISVAISPDGRTLAGISRGEVTVYSATDLAVLTSFKAVEGDRPYISFLDNDLLLVSCSASGNIRLWKIERVKKR